ncbi:hypothetical protein SAMN05216388_10557 [Halorientalis persicus]|uniref:Uncharacterized protein n=1 Tax=Halorientalis persicus TaxID=1367881 RepID=A0A1H8WCI7_9EURY|nr:hypothetical protein [Halorientalis persicus]SEP25382.1 hypothetical protein SAMN05216388_10557 [Halorientalis persicus]
MAGSNQIHSTDARSRTDTAQDTETERDITDPVEAARQALSLGDTEDRSTAESGFGSGTNGAAEHTGAVEAATDPKTPVPRTVDRLDPVHIPCSWSRHRAMQYMTAALLEISEHPRVIGEYFAPLSSTCQVYHLNDRYYVDGVPDEPGVQYIERSFLDNGEHNHYLDFEAARNHYAYYICTGARLDHERDGVGNAPAQDTIFIDHEDNLSSLM